MSNIAFLPGSQDSPWGDLEKFQHSDCLTGSEENSPGRRRKDSVSNSARLKSSENFLGRYGKDPVPNSACLTGSGDSMGDMDRIQFLAVLF